MKQYILVLSLFLSLCASAKSVDIFVPVKFADASINPEEYSYAVHLCGLSDSIMVSGSSENTVKSKITKKSNIQTLSVKNCKPGVYLIKVTVMKEVPSNEEKGKYLTFESKFSSSWAKIDLSEIDETSVVPEEFDCPAVTITNSTYNKEVKTFKFKM